MKKSDNKIYCLELRPHKRKPVDIYYATKHELNQIAQGSCADIWYSISVSCLFAIISLVDANDFSHQISLKTVTIIVLCLVGGCFSAYIGWKRRKESSDTLKEIIGK